MRPHEALCHVVAQEKARIVHAKRIEDVPPKIAFQVLPGYRLNHLAYKIDANAVFPIGTRIEQQWHTQGIVLAGQNAREVDELDVAREVGVENVVAIARGMRQQVLERDRDSRIAKPWRALCIESLQHFHIFYYRQYLTHRLLKTDTIFSTSCMAAAPVTALVIDAIRNTESIVV